MENNIEFIFNSLNQFSKKHNMDIIINNSSKTIFYRLIKSKNVLNKMTKDIKIKRKIKTMILNTNNNKYNFDWQINLEKNKYIFIISSLVLSLINRKENNKNNDLSSDEQLLDYIFHFILKMYKNNLVSFHYITLFFHLYLDLIEKNYTKISEKIMKMMEILPYFKKLIILESERNINNTDEKLLKSINIDIYEILRKIFMMNNSINMKNFKFTNNLREQEKIFDLIKFVYNYYGKNLISENNKNYIKSNLINLYINNFSNSQFNYLYNIYKKIIRNFNNKNCSNKLIESKISFMNGINEFFLELYNTENGKAQKNELYFDKYFIFDINENNSGLKTSQIKFDTSLFSGISIIFSFYAIRYNYTYNNPQVLLTLRNQENENYLFKILLIGNKLYLATFNSQVEEKSVLLENVVYYSYNICVLYYDQKINFLYFYLNKDSNAQRVNLDIKKNSKVFAEIGYTYSDSLQNEIFNGLIGPVLIFNSNIETKNQYGIVQNILSNLKGKYYLIGETIETKNQNNDPENNYIYFNQIYYNTIDNNKLKLINKIQNELGKLLLYINPDVVLNTIGFDKKNQFRDYQYYFCPFNNSLALVKNKIYYYFNSLGPAPDYPKREKNLLYSFMNNKGYDLIVFNLEYIFNYLLILNGKYEDLDLKLM